MITEGETIKTRRMARELGGMLNADYCFFEFDEHENATLVLKYGDFHGDTDVEDIQSYIRGDE